ncbi:MAG: hypothetical protein HC896_01600 [Bacteroidales bacterium]|nr:hypothetical protein [Bacteroidales bacterium]
MVRLGLVQVRFQSLVNSGITLRGNGVVQMEGGTLTVNQIRTSTLGATHVGGYIQTGGTVNIVGGSSNTDYYLFNLTFPGNVFTMKGGVLNITESNSNGGIFINSDPGNQEVTGGTINIYGNNNNNFVITSRAPFYNLTMQRTAGNGIFILGEGTNVGTTDVDLSIQPLVVLNDLNIKSNTTFKTDSQNVTIGRNFTIEDGAVYDYDDNTTIFNGSQNATLYIGDITAITPASVGYTDPEGPGFDPYADWEHPFYGFTVNKTGGARLTLASKNPGSTGNTTAVKTAGGGKNIYDWRSNLIKVGGPFTLESGSLDVDLYSIRLYDDITNKGQLSLDANPSNALIKLRTESLPSTRIITTVDGASFGNLRLNSGASIIEFTSDVYVKRLEYKHGRINIGSHNLTIDTLDVDLNTAEVPTGDFSVEDMIISAGNASDGGLSLYLPANTAFNTDIVFPLGIGATGLPATSKYTPVRIRLNKQSFDDGYITIVPVNRALAILNGGTTNALQYYWRVKHTGFTAVPDSIRMRLWYLEGDVNGTETNYVPGRILSDYTREADPLLGAAGVDNVANRIRFSDGPLTIADYTAGDPSKFTGSPNIYYSRGYDFNNEDDPYWTVTNAWTLQSMLNSSYSPHDSRQPAAGSYPVAGDIAVIGYVPWEDPNYVARRGEPHGIRINNNTQQCAEVVFTQMLDAGGNPTARRYRTNYQFRPTLCISGNNGQLIAGSINGEGLVRLRDAEPDLTGIDMGLFAQEDSSYVVYENFTNNNIISNTPAQMPNLLASADQWGANDINMTFSDDLDILGNLEVLGNTNLVLSSGATGDINVMGDLYVFESTAGGYISGGGASILYPNDADRHITIGRDLIIENTGAVIQVINPNTTVNTHTLEIGRDIYQASAGGGTDGLQLWSAAANDRIELVLSGAESMAYTLVSGDVPSLYRLVLNKDIEDATAHFTGDFNLNGPTSGAGVAKALSLQSGRLILDNAAIDINLSTGNDNFSITAGACLEMRQGQVNVSGNNTGIYLDGRLEINGGSVNLNDAVNNGNNFIEYSSSGSAELVITNGTLDVGSQIRRGLLVSYGVLNYTQTGGSVTVGINAAPQANRGVFEIVGQYSQFNFIGGDLTIVRQQPSATVAALYLDPDNANVSTNTNIYIGNASTPASQNIGIYSNIALPKLTITNNGANSATASMWTVPLTVTDTIDIQANTSFNANGLDLFLEGDLINAGTFNANNNTTYFSGLGNQEITGPTSFYNLIKSSTGDLALNTGINHYCRHILM